MTQINESSINVIINDTDPQECREQLIKALASSLRWYALNPDKRKEDGDHAAKLCELLSDLSGSIRI